MQHRIPSKEEWMQWIASNPQLLPKQEWIQWAKTKPLPEMSKEDWIILRLLRVAVHLGGERTVDVAMSLSYLHNKYGKWHLFDCIELLKGD